MLPVDKKNIRVICLPVEAPQVLLFQEMNKAKRSS